MEHKDGIRINKVKGNLKNEASMVVKRKRRANYRDRMQTFPQQHHPQGASSSSVLFYLKQHVHTDANMHKGATYITESGDWSLH